MEIPQPRERAARDFIRAWIADARDAAEACKLAIVRLSRPEDIATLGAQLEEHERFAKELGALLGDPDAPPAYHDVPAVGATLADEDVLRAIARTEEERRGRLDRALDEARGSDAVRALLAGECARARARAKWARERAAQLRRATAA